MTFCKQRSLEEAFPGAVSGGAAGFLGWGAWRNSDAINDIAILVTKPNCLLWTGSKATRLKTPVSLSIRPIGAVEFTGELMRVVDLPATGRWTWRQPLFTLMALIRRHGKPGPTGQSAPRA